MTAFTDKFFKLNVKFNGTLNFFFETVTTVNASIGF